MIQVKIYQGGTIIDIDSEVFSSLRTLRVDLSTGKLFKSIIEPDIFTNFLGGRGIGVKILYDELDPLVDAYSRSNKLIIASGPLTGTPVPFGCRYEVITKSPLTGTITASNAGGRFGTFLRRSGFDILIIEGCSKEPVYLKLDGGSADLISCPELWGKNTKETTDWLLKKYFNNNAHATSVACLGPAAENLVRFASIINDFHRAAGRGGVGAVLGSKKLKAITVSGSEKPILYDVKKFNNVVKMLKEKIKKTTVTNINLPKYGTAKILDSANNYKLLGTRNFTLNYFEHAKKINAEMLNKRFLIKQGTCFGCPVGCKRLTQVDDETGEGPEFETIWAFGAHCGIKDLKTITKANYLCNKLGLDTISTGNTIGCAMELAEKGLISDKLKFGNSRIILKLVKDIAARAGLGDRLADGSARFAATSGHPELSMSVKGLELPAYDPRVAQAQGLGYATSTRGACHVRAFVVKSDMAAGPQKTDKKTINEKSRLVIKSQNKMAVIDSLGMCLFSTFVCDVTDYRSLLEGAVGIKIGSDDDLLKLGERIWTIERLFNQQAGFTREHDRLPKRFSSEPVFDDLDYEHVWPEKQLIEDYYKERSWTKTGTPKKQKLNELGIRNT